MSSLQANLLLLLASAFWGCGNIAQKTVLDHLDPMSAVGLRCLIGAALIAPFALRQLRNATGRRYCVSVARFGVPFALSLAVQQYAFLGTSVTNAGFLVNMATVLTPVVAWALLGERPTRLVVLAAGTTLLGALLISGGLGGSIARGDLAAVAAAAGFALWMVELGRHMRDHGGACAAAFAQFLLAAAVALPFGAAFGDLSVVAAVGAGPELLFLGVFSTAIGFGIQTVAQRFTSSSHAAVIVSAESVFGAAGGALLLGERVSGMGALGCALVLAAIVMLARPERRTETGAGGANGANAADRPGHMAALAI